MIGAALELSGGTIATLVVVWLITQISLAVGSAYVTLRLLRQQTQSLSDSLDALSTTVGTLGSRVEGLRHDRTQCELRAAGRYATRDELGRLLVDQTEAWRRAEGKLGEAVETMRGSVSRVHERVDGIDRTVAHLQGRLTGAGKENRDADQP